MALPNDYGNSNGFVPTEPPTRPAFSGNGRPSLFRRALGAFLPAQYARLPTNDGDVESGTSGAEGSRRVVGGGVENDGVFANVMAKPGRAVQVRNDDGSIYMAPEEAQNQAPPVSHEGSYLWLTGY